MLRPNEFGAVGEFPAATDSSLPLSFWFQSTDAFEALVRLDISITRNIKAASMPLGTSKESKRLSKLRGGSTGHLC